MHITAEEQCGTLNLVQCDQFNVSLNDYFKYILSNAEEALQNAEEGLANAEVALPNAEEALRITAQTQCVTQNLVKCNQFNVS